MRDLETIRRMELEDWDRNAAFYRDDAESPLMRHLSAQRDAFYDLQPGQRVLDLGCGAGATVARLRARGIEAIGVDFSPAMINAARAQFALGDRVHCADATQLPFDDATFDAVIADGVLHHLAVQGRLMPALREARRVLKPNGRLCVFDRNGSLMSSLLLRIAIGVKQALCVVTGQGHYASSATRNEIPFGGRSDRRFLERMGFKALRHQAVASAPFFMSVVVLNAVQYFLSRRLREKLERPLTRLIAWIDARCAWPALCVEQVSVWEPAPRLLKQQRRQKELIGAQAAAVSPLPVFSLEPAP